MRLLPLCVLAPLAACSAPAGHYPSLLPRPIEKRALFAAPEPPPIAAPSADPATDIAISEQRQALGAAARAFDPAADEAERLARAARGAAAGSEPWLAAQIALSELDTLRTRTASIVTDVERLAIDRAAEGKPAYPPLAALLEDAKARVAAERARIAAIEGGLTPA